MTKNPISILQGAFKDCFRLKKIVFSDAGPGNIGHHPIFETDLLGVFDEDHLEKTVVIVPKAKKEEYKSHERWGDFKFIIDSDEEMPVIKYVEPSKGIIGGWTFETAENDYVLSCNIYFNSNKKVLCELVLDAGDGESFELYMKTTSPGSYKIDGDYIKCTFDESRTTFTQKGPRLLHGSAGEQATFEARTRDAVDFLRKVLYEQGSKVFSMASSGKLAIRNNTIRISSTTFENISHDDNLATQATKK